MFSINNLGFVHKRTSAPEVVDVFHTDIEPIRTQTRDVWNVDSVYFWRINSIVSFNNLNRRLNDRKKSSAGCEVRTLEGVASVYPRNSTCACFPTTPSCAVRTVPLIVSTKQEKYP